MDARRGEYVRTRSSWPDASTVMVLIVMLSGVSCGGDDETESQESVLTGDCPFIAGTWTIKVHCSLGLVNTKIEVMQSSCLIYTEGAIETNGAIRPDGSFLLRGTSQGLATSCGGVV